MYHICWLAPGREGGRKRGNTFLTLPDCSLSVCWIKGMPSAEAVVRENVLCCYYS